MRGRVEHRGFSLVELLVAATLGVLLGIGVISVFLNNQRSAAFNEELADMQESARFALNAMARDVRLAGYQGCTHVDSVAIRAPNILADDPPTSDLLATAARGFAIGADGSWTPGAPGDFDSAAAGAVIGSHALGLQYGGPAIGRLAAAQATTEGIPSPIEPLPVSDDPDSSFTLEEGDLALVSDCTRVELFRVSDTSSDGAVIDIAHEASHNTSGSFEQPFGTTAAMREETQVMRFNANVYYVAPNGHRNSAGDPSHSLYRQSLPYDDPIGNPPLELVDGVETLRFAFGIETLAGSLRYVTPDDPHYDPRAVKVVRIGLLMRSRERIGDADDRDSYVLAGQRIGPAESGVSDPDTHSSDRRVRLAFNITAKIRNRRR